ncbi:subtilisin-like serine protease [Dinochytrium kinnereticum]|nr:subtilisin-like serine protease [Dinochytrium kinnereticum]
MHLIKVIALAVAAFLPGSIAAPTLINLKAGTKIPNQYIIVYKNDANASLIESHESWRADLGAFPKIAPFNQFSYLRKYSGSKALKGYTARMSADIAEAIKTLPEVDYVEQDAVASIMAVQTSPPSWGLRRISKPDLPLPADFTYPDTAGAGVNVYIIDSGVQISHPEFEGRASIGVSYSRDRNNIDGSGHGTHVAGTVASKTYGVAKKANIIAVKVLGSDGTGSNSDVIAGVNWVALNGPRSGKPCIVNMSLGGPASSAVDRAVTAGVNAGCAFVVAAGNGGANACNNSPARAPAVFTVASSDINDVIAGTSDRGTCVDIIAPGASITSTWIRSGIRTISGTSMASPHVAGVFAIAASNGVPANQAALTEYVTSIAVSGKISGLTSATTNLLLQIPKPSPLS